jgi:hypothetical protein
MSNQEIRSLFDSHPNLLMSEITLITGKSIRELKRILMGDQT